MHNQEENEAAVTTVTSNKISKERGKTMKNEKTSLNIRKLKKQVKGITLIALVVTIIVLLILAGIAINLTIGDNGIFKRAENARDTWEIAQSKEQSEMDKAADFIGIYEEGANTGKTVSEAISQNKFYTTNTTIKDDLENEVVIPAYFKLAADSATKVEDGIVIEDLDGNQFVWIPAKTEEKGGATINLSSGGTTTIVYQRADFGKQAGSYSDYSETMPSDEEASVNAWGGYYIGRYEAGDKESTEAKTMRTEGSSKTNTITIKSNQVPYTYITQADAKIKAEEMDTVQGYITATTKLVSSYAWDTSINFIQIKNSDYGTNSPEGNYYNIAFKYTDITGEKQTKDNNTSILVSTGQTTAVSNIYDLGGNAWEYTDERSSYEDISESSEFQNRHYVDRGGAHGSWSSSNPAGYRGSNDGSAQKYEGFRVTLYCKIES